MSTNQKNSNLADAPEASNFIDRIEAPVTFKAYLLCAFACFGGIFFGYDSGYINGVNASREFINAIEYPGAPALTSSHQSLIVSILSCGTFFGSIMAGDLADIFGRRITIIAGCFIYMAGVIIQMVRPAPAVACPSPQFLTSSTCCILFATPAIRALSGARLFVHPLSQFAASGLATIVVGRLIAGVGVGYVCASEYGPRS